jgi:transcriptional regulator with GAF, ATPase, and Fis domain
MGLNGAPSVLVQSHDPVRLILEVLRENEGNLLRAAHELNVDRKTLRKHVTRHGLWPALNRLRREATVRRRRRT